LIWPCMLCSPRKLGLPQRSRDTFGLLEGHRLVGDDLRTKMTAMVGFRDPAVHNYQELNLEILQVIIERHLDDFDQFIQAAMDWILV